MNDKLSLTNVGGDTHKKGTMVRIYWDTQEMLKDLSARTGLSKTVLANKMIKYAYNHAEVEGEQECRR